MKVHVHVCIKLKSCESGIVSKSERFCKIKVIPVLILLYILLQRSALTVKSRIKGIKYQFHFQSCYIFICFSLFSHSKCDCCGGPLYGPGLKTIRPVSKIFGIKNLPFMFRCCSAYCYNMFCENTDSLMDMLYGCSSWKEIMETKS